MTHFRRLKIAVSFADAPKVEWAFKPINGQSLIEVVDEL